MEGKTKSDNVFKINYFYASCVDFDWIIHCSTTLTRSINISRMMLSLQTLYKIWLFLYRTFAKF